MRGSRTYNLQQSRLKSPSCSSFLHTLGMLRQVFARTSQFPATTVRFYIQPSPPSAMCMGMSSAVISAFRSLLHGTLLMGSLNHPGDCQHFGLVITISCPVASCLSSAPCLSDTNSPVRISVHLALVHVQQHRLCNSLLI